MANLGEAVSNEEATVFSPNVNFWELTNLFVDQLLHSRASGGVYVVA